MRRTNRRSVRRSDSGAAWISYSDMMAALLLVFVLVLCFSIYQYFIMLETKSAELSEKESQLTEQEAKVSSQKELLDKQQLVLDNQTITLKNQQTELKNSQAELAINQQILDDALAVLDDQQSMLSDQSLTLAEQEEIIAAAQANLVVKEGELATANEELALKEEELNKASALLTQQQTAMSTQQRKLDDLVGVRTQIIRELSVALSSANLKAVVDENTGDIVLESTVFFDVNQNKIKPEGEELLNRFIPIYLGVLLQKDYVDFLGEIVIEGHTDPSGGYLMNLELSQERALSVATFCLEIPGLTPEQQERLRGILTAKGRSYSDPVVDANGNIDENASRRVEFKFRLKDSEMIDELRTILAGEG